MVIEYARRGARASTAVAIAGPRLLSVDLTGPDGTKGVPAKGRGRIALAVLPGIVDPDSLAITARFHGWPSRTVDRTARRALAPDPAMGETWEAVAERAYPPRRAGFTCVRWAQALPRFSHEPFEIPTGECGDVLQEPFFFAVRAMREYDQARRRLVVTKRAVFGAAGPEVSAVTITDPDGSRSPELSRRGRAFISMYPASVSVEELSVTVSLRDGSTATYAGRRGVGIDTPRKPPLP